MSSQYAILLFATLYALTLGAAAIVRKKEALASWCFLFGALALAADSGMGALAIATDQSAAREFWYSGQLVAKAFLPGAWLCFSLIYCRGNAGEFLKRWRGPMLLAAIVPPALAISTWHGLVTRIHGADGVPVFLFERTAQTINTIVLICCVVVLMNLEKTMRSAVGTVRWRIKYFFIGAGLIFGVKIYTLSQSLLFSAFNPTMSVVDGVALLIGCVLMTVAYVRKGFGELDLYPSQTVLQGSLTIVLVGGYLVVVGLFAQLAATLGLPSGIPVQAFVILVGLVGLAAALLSDRVRATARRQIVRHFSRPQHDSRAIWTKYTRSTFEVMDSFSLCRAASEVISSSFNVLTIRILLFYEGGTLQVASSTFDGEVTGSEEDKIVPLTREQRDQLEESAKVFGLEDAPLDWHELLREHCPSQFSHGGERLAVMLRTSERVLGVMVLADRVAGVAWSQEERDLLSCLGDQLASGLLNIRLSAEQMESKELEAFQTMSTFFVHDLKNAAHSLGLMIQNLPEHFDDPEFRSDALRGLGKSADRINNMISQLSGLRNELQPIRVDCDLNELVRDTLDQLGSGYNVEVELGEVPRLWLDLGRIRSVLSNLVINAAEASGGEAVLVKTDRMNGNAVIEVSDRGCGMSSKFIRESLFKPFSTTKSKGLGIGMFQSKMIVEAHEGTIEVQSAPEKGTVFRVLLPLE